MTSRVGARTLLASKQCHTQVLSFQAAPGLLHSQRRRKGAVLIELTLAIPILAGVIALTFFFGFAMVNQQHVIVAARYTAWAEVADSNNADRMDELDEQNVMFFNLQAGSTDFDSEDRHHDTLGGLVDEASLQSADAGMLISLCVPSPWPRGRWTNVSAEFPTDVAAFAAISGAIERSHFRDGVQWRRGEVSYLRAIRDAFLTDLDTEISQIPDADLRDRLGRLYLQRW